MRNVFAGTLLAGTTVALLACGATEASDDDTEASAEEAEAAPAAGFTGPPGTHPESLVP